MIHTSLRPASKGTAVPVCPHRIIMQQLLSDGACKQSACTLECTQHAQTLTCNVIHLYASRHRSCLLLRPFSALFAHIANKEVQMLACLICRFVKNQLVVEITSSAKLAHIFGWIMRRHSLVAYSLYTAGQPPQLSALCRQLCCIVAERHAVYKV